MANLVSVVMQFLTPDMIAKIASALGLDRTLAQRAIGGAVPALLASFADAATTPGGARQLSNMLSQQQAGALDSLKGLAGGSNPKMLADSGTSMLSGLLGGGVLDTIAQSIGQFAGLSEGTSKSMLGMLGPVVLGALGEQQRTAGLDTGGVMSLLASQKDQITAAIPSGLADRLGAAGLIDRAEGSMRSGAAAAASRMASASERVTTAATYASTRATPTQWPYWLAAIVVLGGLAWYVMERPGTETVAQAPRPAATTTTGTVGMAPPNMTVGGVNLVNQLNSSVGTLRTVLPSITDNASAQAALPKIRAAADQLNDLKTRAANLTPEGKSALARLTASATPAINQMCDKILATPGVGDIAKPAIDDLRAKLDTLSHA